MPFRAVDVVLFPTDGGIMTKTGRIGTGAGLVHAQGVYLSTDPSQGHVRVHGQRGNSVWDINKAVF